MIYAKYEAMEKLCYHKNITLANERWHEYREEIAILRKMAKQIENR